MSVENLCESRVWRDGEKMKQRMRGGEAERRNETSLLHLPS